MADEEENTEEVQETGGKKKLIIIVAVAVVLLLAAVGGGVFFYLQSAEPEAGAEDGVVEEEAHVPLSEKPIYQMLRPEFVVTFDANNRQRYVQIQVTLVTRDPQMVAAIGAHDPLIRNTLIMLFSKQDYLELQTGEGKRLLKVAATEAIRKLMLDETGSDALESVLFTNFVMQ
jgi:flagellar FliL protein